MKMFVKITKIFITVFSKNLYGFSVHKVFKKKPYKNVFEKYYKFLWRFFQKIHTIFLYFIRFFQKTV